MDAHEEYMMQALALAREAAVAGEVPVGCVIVHGGEIVGRGRNRREEKGATASHAEMEAITAANEALHALCHARTLPNVRRSHSQRAHPTRILRRARPRDGRLRRGV